MHGIELRVVCAWCAVEMKPGATLDGLVSHSCCCDCKVKYFPTLADASEHQWELIGQDHESCADGNSPREIMCHIDKRRCSRCEMIEDLDPYPCDCDEANKNAFPEHD